MIDTAGGEFGQYQRAIDGRYRFLRRSEIQWTALVEAGRWTAGHSARGTFVLSVCGVSRRMMTDSEQQLCRLIHFSLSLHSTQRLSSVHQQERAEET